MMMEETSAATMNGKARPVCELCGKVFSWSSSLVLHMRTHTGEKPYSCDVCMKTFTQKVHLQRHSLVHKKIPSAQSTPPPPPSSSMVPSSMPPKTAAALSTFNLMNLALLQNAVSFVNASASGGMSPLGSLQSEHSSPDLLAEALPAYTDDALTPSNLDEAAPESPVSEAPIRPRFSMLKPDRRMNGGAFARKRFMPKPVRRQQLVDGGEVDRQTECPECKEKFMSKLEMVEHLCVAHQQEQNEPAELREAAGSPKQKTVRTTLCLICNKNFATPSSLNLHMRSHTGERPYTCRYCGKAFIQNIHLKAHLSKHTGEKPYQCRFCGKAFAIQYSLKVHENVHVGRRGHTCKICSKSFFQQYQLLRHMMSHVKHRGARGVSEAAPTMVDRDGGRLELDGGDVEEGEMEEQIENSQSSEEELIVEEGFVEAMENGEESRMEEKEIKPTISDRPTIAMTKVGGSLKRKIQFNRKNTLVSDGGLLNRMFPPPLTNGGLDSDASSRGGATLSEEMHEKSKISPSASLKSETNESSPEPAANCSKCACVANELQLLKAELGSMKLFLGNKITLMEQRIEGILSYLPQ